MEKVGVGISCLESDDDGGTCDRLPGKTAFNSDFAFHFTHLNSAFFCNFVSKILNRKKSW